MSEQQSHKAHRASQSGKKAEKKDVAQGKDKSGGHKGFNEKVSKLSGARPSVHAD
jgi:ribosome biogenesis protein BMS1